MPLDRAAFDETLTNARRRLLDARNAAGHWEGELSSSALSTATAVFALHCFVAYGTDDSDAAKRLNLSAQEIARCNRLVREGLAWLAIHQNADGGWGDTTASLSNVSTTALCWSAFVADENWAAGAYDATLRAAEKWLSKLAGSLQPDALAKVIADRYGEDRTFSVPILTMMALAGRLGPGAAAWDLVTPLPFELAAFPQWWFKWLKLPVVSYALPALIAIGQVRHAKRPSTNPATRLARTITRRRTLKLLRRIQPTSGGFLEATPLTSFVAMSLAGAGAVDDPVVWKGVEFLKASVRPDGSWPIDTNLATWVTTLAINALANNPDFHQVMPADERAKVRDWLLGQQYRKEHPYTLADPGGWAWTDLPGGVPDADDTPGALLALKNLGDVDDRVRHAAAAGVRWLLGLQNRDGGIPTFCRGWGKLPFDRSSPDLTAHTIRGVSAWLEVLNRAWRGRVRGRLGIAAEYLARHCRREGCWIPLWFGNQHGADDVNPTYGTSRVLVAAAEIVTAFVNGGSPPGERPHPRTEVLTPGAEWLIKARNADGGWGAGPGTPSSTEETSLAVEALCALATVADRKPIEGEKDFPSSLRIPRRARAAAKRGVAWLILHTDRGRSFPPSPIGFYFAKLWYWEQLYPLVWTVAALEAANRVGLWQAAEEQLRPVGQHAAENP